LTESPNNRVETRANVFLSAVLDTGSQVVPIRIRNISSNGALIDGTNIPDAGSNVVLLRGSLSANGHVAWRESAQAGIRFDHVVNTTLWVAKSGHGGQQRVDEIVTAIKRSNPLPRAPKLNDGPTLPEISATLEAICDRLGTFPEISDAFGEELVKLDAVAQSLRRISGKN
jgi:hypothetical protein